MAKVLKNEGNMRDLVDGFGRKIDYLRISVTKNCNFRCLYCMPSTQKHIDESVIPLHLMLEFAKIAMDFGVKKIRITGGEPLLRKDLSDFIAGIYRYKNDVEVALTTNGYFLAQNALSLKEAGLKRINISLDSLEDKKIVSISKKDALKAVLDGIFKAKEVGLKIKLNMVPLKNINDDEMIAMLYFAIENGFLLRYIEYMSNAFASGDIVGLKGDEILAILRKEFDFMPLAKEHFGPAKLYEITHCKNNNAISKVFGIIAPHSDDFCQSCNRIRLTADGVICPCLYFEDAINVSKAIRNGDKIAMREALLQAVANKPEKNKWSNNLQSSRAFYHTGG